MKRTNPNFVNGVPELLILQLLTAREMYGYAIVKAIQSRSDEKFTFGEGCIYPLLHSMEKRKLVSSSRKQVDGRSRYYYRISTRGLKQLQSLKQEWETVAAGVGLLLNPGGTHA